MAEKRDQEYEALLDNYEDAIMRLVMYRVAQEDGKRLLEEAEELERSGFEVPASLDEKCRKLIREAPVQQTKEPAPEQEQARRSRPQRVPVLRTALRMLIAAILAAALLFTVAYASSDEFRVKVLNFFLEVEEKGTYFFFRSDQSEETGNLIPQNSDVGKDFPFQITYLPKEFELGPV